MIAPLIFFLTIFLFGSTLNLLVLIVYRPNSRQYASIFLIFLMATLHFIYSLIVTPIMIAYVALTTYQTKIDNFFCKFIFFMQFTFIGISVSLLTLISFERSKKIKLLSENKTEYLKHKTLAYDSKKASLFLCVFSFILAIFAFAIFQSNDGVCKCVDNDFARVYYIIIICLVILAYGTMVFFYMKAYFTFRQNKKRIFSIQTPVIMVSFIDTRGARNPNSASFVGLSSLIVNKEWKVARIFMLVSNRLLLKNLKSKSPLIRYFQSSALTVITLFLWAYYSLDLAKLEMQNYEILRNLHLSICVVNPVCYLLHSKCFRRDFFHLIQLTYRCLFGCFLCKNKRRLKNLQMHLKRNKTPVYAPKT